MDVEPDGQAPSLQPIASVSCNQDRRGTLKLEWDGDGSDGGVLIRVFGEGARMMLTGNAVTFPDRPPRGTSAREYEVRLDDRRGPAPLTVALVDEQNFPFAIQQVPVLPPFDKSKWRIEFVTAEGGKKVYQRPLFDVQGTKLFLPPGQADLKLKARLIRPDGDLTKSIACRWFAKSAGGERSAMLQKTEIALEPGLTQFDLSAQGRLLRQGARRPAAPRELTSPGGSSWSSFPTATSQNASSTSSSPSCGWRRNSWKSPVPVSRAPS